MVTLHKSQVFCIWSRVPILIFTREAKIFRHRKHYQRDHKHSEVHMPQPHFPFEAPAQKGPVALNSELQQL